MNILRLSELIGQEIIELKFHYIYRNEYDMQTFDAYIKLSSGNIIDIPNSNDDEYLLMTAENLEYMQRRFKTGKAVSSSITKYFVGQKITDFFICYYDNELAFEPGYIQLSNGYYLTENNSGPTGVTNIDLVILDEKQFLERNLDFKKDASSFLQTRINDLVRK